MIFILTTEENTLFSPPLMKRLKERKTPAMKLSAVMGLF